MPCYRTRYLTRLSSEALVDYLVDVVTCLGCSEVTVTELNSDQVMSWVSEVDDLLPEVIEAVQAWLTVDANLLIEVWGEDSDDRSDVLIGRRAVIRTGYELVPVVGHRIGGFEGQGTAAP
jgi:hypothetical protein